MAMLPQIGQGFFWEIVSKDTSEDRATACIFVPESKRLFNVSFSTKGFSKEDRDALYPPEWIEWAGVGARDYTKPFPLEGVTIMDRNKDRPIRPEYTNQTAFKSMLIFPDREDLVRFVGKNNAWSPHAGIVVCDDTAEILRGTYCFGYIERMSGTTDSNKFCVKSGTLKYPDGYMSENDRITFEGLAKEIEQAAEEAAIMAKKGRAPGDDCQIIPAQTRQVADDFGDYDNYGENPRAVKTKLTGPGWSKFKSAAERNDILRRAEFIKDHRFNHIIVYKESSKGKGFIGFTPLVGTVKIVATQHKSSDRRLVVGDTIRTRVELNKRTMDFVVESIVDIGPEFFLADFEIREASTTTELILKCRDLDLRAWKTLPEGDKWQGKKWGEVEHPVLGRILVPQETAMKKEWAGKKVMCTILHYEGMENRTPGRIRLILEEVVGLAEEDSMAPNKVDFPSGIPDNVDSDDEEDDDEEEDDGRGTSYEEEGEQLDRRSNGNGGSGFPMQEPLRSVFARNDNYNGGGGFSSNWSNDSGDGGRYERSDRGGRGYEERGSDRGRGGGGMGGRGGRGGRDEGWGNQRPYSNRSSPDPYQQEGHGFGAPTQQKPSMNGEGIVVIYSKKDSYLYMANHKLVIYEGDIQEFGITLGDSAAFGMDRSDSLIPFKVVPGHIKKIRDVFPDFFDGKKMIYQGELYIRVRGRLTPLKDCFECELITNVKLDSTRQDLKLYNYQFVKKSRLLVDHFYDIYVKMSSDTWDWQFECIDEAARSFVLEEEDEIEREKKLLLQAERPSSRSSRSGDEWEKVNPMRSGPSKGFGPSSRDSDQMSGSRYSEDRPLRSVPSKGFGTSSRDSDQMSGSRYSEDRPQFSKPSKAPSVASSRASTFTAPSTMMTSTTVTSEKEVKELRRQLTAANRMLKNVWDYKPVQQTVKTDNYFMYESIAEYVNTLIEDESEMNN